MGKTINVKDHGALGDVKTVFPRGSINAGSDVLKLTAGIINKFDNTKKISISRLGGRDVKPFRTAIKSVLSRRKK